MSLTAGQTLAHYRITGAIGAGGMGEVYRATDTKLGRDVAIKVLPSDLAQDSERLARFEREARLLASLNHPNIAHVYGFEGVTLGDGSMAHFLAMELVDGEDLGERLKRGPIPVDEAIALAKQIAEALEEAHEKGIVHRDLKPANVKLAPDGKVKVLDFGLAKAWTGDGTGSASSADVSHSPTMTRATEAGMILGTAAYMPPEQARGKAVDKRADIWAFGVVLWEMLTGRQLFVGETVSDVLAAVLTREIEWTVLPPQVPRPLREALRRCLDRNPKQRLHDIADARILLDEVIAGGGDESPASGNPVARRQTLLLAAVATLVLVTTGLGWALVRGRTPSRSNPRSVSVVLPDNIWLDADRAGSVAIAADGSRIVVAAEDESQEQLYVREMDSPGLRPLPGTSGATGPFFSPDGRWVAFNAFKKDGLQKVSLDGGAPVAVAPHTFGRGAWSSAGDIYFTAAYNTGLSRVSAAGGTPQELTRPDPGQGELNHSFPELLPGEQALLFTSHRTPLGQSRIEALSLASGERHVVVEHAIEARYLSSGYLAFVRDESLMVAPFDLATLRLTGPALPARHQVAVSYGDCQAEYVLSRNGILALVPREVMPPRREVVRFDRAGRAETILAAEKTYSGPALSPDGRQLAITRNEGGPDVLLYDLERKATTRLATSPRREFGAVWDRSGTRVFFAVDTPTFQIFEVATTGTGEPKVLLEGTDDHTPQDVSPDGQWLLYLESFQNHGVLPLARPKEARLFHGTEGAENFGRFSPDGRFVAFQANGSGRDEIYVRPVFEAARSLPVSRAGGQQPRWAKSGDLFFWQGDQLFAVPVRTKPTLQVGEPRPLFRTGRGARTQLFEGDYDVSADGQSIYLARTPDLLRPREVRVVLDWTAEVAALFAPGGGS